jgi:hypothetical protein
VGVPDGLPGVCRLGLLALLLSERFDSPSRWAGVWVVGVAAMMTSGMALSMLAWLAVFVLLRHGLRSALVAAVPPVLVYPAWYVAVGHLGAHDRLADLGTTIRFRRQTPVRGGVGPP